MRVFKFGGASVKDAAGVKNVVQVLETMGHKNTLVVVSAMGKTTNAMEALVAAYFSDKKSGLQNEFEASLGSFLVFHRAICRELFPSEQHSLFTALSVF